MSLHPTTFEYLQPTVSQIKTMEKMRAAFAQLAHEVDDMIRPGVDKDYILRSIREAAMWANVAITREADGTPRQ